ncbi:hypothetical protein INR49_007540 [Caranx melampygus]|nr:hypothetical protein INR49_007540 [Caranx melampygus]
MVSLLPPVGTEVFRCFTSASLEEEHQTKKNKEVEEKSLPEQSIHLKAEKPLPFIYGDPPPELLNTPLEELDPSHQSQKTFIVLSKGNVLHRFLTPDIVNLGKVSALRFLPRALKMISVYPGVKTTAGALIQSLKRLAEAVVLLVFVTGLLAVIGLQLFMGSLKQSCVIWPINVTEDYTYAYTACFTCLRTNSNPNYGFTNYDSIGWSLLSVLSLMMQDNWEDLAIQMFQAKGKSSVIVFLLLVFSSSFFLFSVILAFVAMALFEKDRAEVSEAKQREDEFNKIQEVMKRRGEEEELHTFVTNPFFDFIIVICLILNTLFLATEHYPMTLEFDEHLSISYLVFTWIFTAEMLLRLVAMGPSGYFKVGWHRFDFILVIGSLLELGLCDVGNFSMLHSFSLMRVLRLARWWPSFHLFIQIVWTTLSALRNLTLILLVMVLIFTVVGMQMFHRDYECSVCRIAVDCEFPRWHMNDLFHTFILIFRVLCGEWVNSMWDCMEASSLGVCVIFFMVVVVVGHLLVLNLFLSLLLSSVVGDRLSAPTEEGQNNLSSAINQIKGCAAQTRTWIQDGVLTLFGQKNHVNPDIGGDVDLGLTSVTSDQQGSEVKVNTPECCYRCCLLDVDTSRGAGRVWSNFRRTCFTIAEHKYFKAFIIFIIFLSSAALVFEDIYLQQQPLLKMIVDQADQVFTYLFLVEMLLKWVAYGLRKYFTNAWCWIDFLILAVRP